MKAISIFNRYLVPVLFIILMVSSLTGCHLWHHPHGHRGHHGHHYDSHHSGHLQGSLKAKQRAHRY